jgi:hypothetical protein
MRSCLPTIEGRSQGLADAYRVGFESASGQVVSFPADGCTYAPTALEQVVKCLRRHPRWNGVRGRSIDQLGQPERHWAAYVEPSQQGEVWQQQRLCTSFLRRSVIRQSELDENALLSELTVAVYYNRDVQIEYNRGSAAPSCQQAILPMDAIHRFFLALFLCRGARLLVHLSCYISPK